MLRNLHRLRRIPFRAFCDPQSFPKFIIRKKFLEDQKLKPHYKSPHMILKDFKNLEFEEVHYEAS